MIKLLDLLKEIGEASSRPYDWTVTDYGEGELTYEFTTDIGNLYYVQLDEGWEKGEKGVNVIFMVEESGDESDYPSASVEKVVNKGEMYRVMATITNIIKSYIRKNPDIEFIAYNPSSKKGEEEIDNQRNRLYKAFITKQIPGATFEPMSRFSMMAHLPEKEVAV